MIMSRANPTREPVPDLSCPVLNLDLNPVTSRDFFQISAMICDFSAFLQQVAIFLTCRMKYSRDRGSEAKLTNCSKL